MIPAQIGLIFIASQVHSHHQQLAQPAFSSQSSKLPRQRRQPAALRLSPVLAMGDGQVGMANS
jgi:hypothetical protein